MDVPSRVAEPRDAVAKALAPSVQICSYNDCENRQVGDGDDKEEEDNEIQSASEDEDDDGELDYQEENDPFTDELLGLFSDGDGDSDYDGKEQNVVNFWLA